MLSEAGNEVVLLDHNPRRARAIALGGIRLEGPEGIRSVPIHVTSQASSIGVADLVCICVKAYDTASAMERAMPLVNDATVVASLQNGLGNAEQIARHIDVSRVVCVVTSCGATSLGPGHIRRAGEGRTAVAPFDAKYPERAASFQSVLVKCGMLTELLPDAAGMLWSKLVVNAAINPATAIWNVSNGSLLDAPERRSAVMAAAGEAEQVAKAGNIKLMYDDAIAEVERTCLVTRDNISSMLQDVRSGKKTEIESINGAIVREARSMGLQTPVNEDFLNRVRSIESQSSA